MELPLAPSQALRMRGRPPKPAIDRRPPIDHRRAFSGQHQRAPSYASYGPPMPQPPPYQFAVPLLPAPMSPASYRTFSPAPMDRYAPQMGFNDITIEAIDTGRYVGRCGSLLFLVLVFGMKHRLKLIERQDVPERREILRQKIAIPQWPVCFVHGKCLVELYATLRFLASSLGLYSDDLYHRYTSDMLIEKLAYWRDHLSALIGEGLDRVTDPDFNSTSAENYMKTSRHAFFSQFDTFLKYSGTTFFLGESISWVDPVVFSVIFEDSTYAWAYLYERKRRTGSDRTTGDSSESFEDPEEDTHESMWDNYSRMRCFVDAFLAECPIIAKWTNRHRQLHTSGTKEALTEPPFHYYHQFHR